MFDSIPVSDVVMVPDPEPEAPIAPSEQIHTIAAGHLLDHDRTSACWCGPLQDADEPRVWHHQGLVNCDHYKGEEVASCTSCGRMMPKGRKGICLACLDGLHAKAETDQEKAMVALLDRAAKA